jgi:hypothetical protein
MIASSILHQRVASGISLPVDGYLTRLHRSVARAAKHNEIVRRGSISVDVVTVKIADIIFVLATFLTFMVVSLDDDLPSLLERLSISLD